MKLFLIAVLGVWLVYKNPAIPGDVGETIASFLDAISTAIRAAKRSSAVG